MAFVRYGGPPSHTHLNAKQKKALRLKISTESIRFDEITGGFDQLSHAALLPGTVQLRSPPEEVESYGDHVHITYQTPDTLTADYMIVATTATAAQLLRSQPPLSHGKENALRSFHYSGVIKVFLACMQSFWEHEGISGGESSTDWPSCFIHYPSHTFPSGTGVILASFTMDDNSSFFAQAADVVLDDLATVHDLSKEELRALCPYSMIKHWSQDSYSMGGFALPAISRPLQSRRKQIMENRSNVKSEYGRRLRNKTKPNHRP
ncbi:hypothetical protein MJG53_007467 [Ovis ammon polii x Ovis aries]|uniref:Uncharacterized protein n=1 Tax=Ovis ammon polii x Ovis aries TaxID=2918886 RepID=A0ACB9V367_9CETA|nr:hypothetical protein MJG53_007467 [Ovis ammon polii x Ovis aries]